MQEWHPEGSNGVGEVGMVGDDHRHRHVQLTAAVAPQQVQQAVILLGRQNRDTLRFGRLGQPDPSRTAWQPGRRMRFPAHRGQVSPGRWKIVRCMKVPPDCSVACWSNEIMFAPDWAKKLLTAATNPGRSVHRSKSRPTSLVVAIPSTSLVESTCAGPT